MNKNQLTASAQASINCYHIGKERQPVLVIDDFLDNPDKLIRSACETAFTPGHGLFPGHRASAPKAYTDTLEMALPGLLTEVFGTQPQDIKQVESSYSLVTQPPATLHPLQRIPHFDSPNPRELASIYFLCNQHSPDYSGTAFYRHRSTGFEYVDQQRLKPYMTALETDAKKLGAPPADYIHGDTEMFEQIDIFEAVFNRILIYRCTSLHSGVIDKDFNFSLNPEQARLSINSFLVS